MKILRLYYRIPPMIGGMEKHIYELSKYQSNENLVNVFFNEGEKLYPSDVKILPKIKLSKIRPNVLGILIFQFFVIVNLIKSKKKYDVIHIHGDWNSLLFVYLIKRLTKSKLIVFSIHDQLTNKIKKNILKILIQQVDLIFTSGSDTAKYLKNFYKNNIYFQPSGINEQYVINHSKYKQNNNVITVANLVPKKNIALIIEIAKICPQFNFYIVGKGPEIGKIKHQINSVKNINLLGFKNLSEIIDLMDNSFAFLLTSFFEGTPTSVLEALSRGLPIISSDVGGLSSIIRDGENGFIIKKYNKNLFKEKLELIYNDSELLFKMRNNNRDLGKEFIWKTVANNITELTKKYLKQKSC